MDIGSVRQEVSAGGSVARRDASFSLSQFYSSQFEHQGFLLLEGLFSGSEIERVRDCVPELLAERTDRTVLESDGNAVRSVYGVHRHHPIFAALARHRRLLSPVRQVLRDDVYVYQSKLNSKGAFDGDQWPWHQDYVYWKEEDGMPAPRALTAAVFLDDVTELNGPIMLIPGSHRSGVLPFDTYEGKPPGYESAPGWIPNLTARLKYTIPKSTLHQLTSEGGIAAPRARAGSVLLFDCNLAHSSPSNLSHLSRTIALYTYNSVENAPPASRLHRPDFLVSRDTRPLTSDSDDRL